MSRSEDRKPAMERNPLPDRMPGEAQARRSQAFLRGTQGRGKQMVYGSGDPGKVPKPKKDKGAKS